MTASEHDTVGPVPAATRGTSISSRRQLGGRPPSRFWRIREDVPSSLRYMLMTASLVVPFVTWVVVTQLELVQPAFFLPGPLDVLDAGRRLIVDGPLVNDAWVSVRRVAIGFGLAIAISVPLGLAMGTYRSIAAIFEPIIAVVRYMPAPAFIPLLIIWLGLGESPKIGLILIGTVFFNTLMTANIVWQVPAELIRVSYTLGASHGAVFRKVIFPYAVPGIIDAARVNFAAAWQLIIVAELIAADEGVGVRIARAQRFLNTDQIFAILIVIGIIGLVCDISLRMLRNRLAPWSQE